MRSRGGARWKPQPRGSCGAGAGVAIRSPLARRSGLAAAPLPTPPAVACSAPATGQRAASQLLQPRPLQLWAQGRLPAVGQVTSRATSEDTDPRLRPWRRRARAREARSLAQGGSLSRTLLPGQNSRNLASALGSERPPCWQPQVGASASEHRRARPAGANRRAPQQPQPPRWSARRRRLEGKPDRSDGNVQRTE